MQTSREKAHQAALEGIDVYLKLLEHPKIAIRSSALGLLKNFSGQGEKIADHLGRLLLKDQLPLFKANLLVAFGELAKPNANYLDLLQSFLNTKQTKKVKLATSYALACLVQEQTPAEAVEILLEAVRHPDEHYHYVDIYGYDAAKALCNVSHKYAHGIIEALTEGIKNSSAYSHNNLFDQLLFIVFEGSPLKTKALTTIHRQALQLLVDNDKTWHYRSTRTNDLLFHFGLPYMRDELRAFLG